MEKKKKRQSANGSLATSLTVNLSFRHSIRKILENMDEITGTCFFFFPNFVYNPYIMPNICVIFNVDMGIHYPVCHETALEMCGFIITGVNGGVAFILSLL